MSIEAIRLSGGKVRFSDASRATPFRTFLTEIRIDVDRLDTEKEKSADALISFRTEAGETFDLNGYLSIDPLSSKGTVALGKVVLKKYAPFCGSAVRFDVASGSLDIRSSYRFTRKDDEIGILISGLSATMFDVRLQQRADGEAFLKIPEASVKDVSIDPARRKIVVGTAVTERGTRISRSAPRSRISRTR